MRLKIIIAGLLKGMIAFTPLSAMANETAIIRFIVTGDLYEFPADKDRVEYAKQASVAKIFKKKTKEISNPIYFMWGDAYYPSLLSTMDKGKINVEMINAIGGDYMVLENHDWDFGPKNVRERVWESNFPVLSSNIIDQDGLPVDGTVRTAMINVGPFRTGIMGLVTTHTKVI